MGFHLRLTLCYIKTKYLHKVLHIQYRRLKKKFISEFPPWERIYYRGLHRGRVSVKHILGKTIFKIITDTFVSIHPEYKTIFIRNSYINCIIHYLFQFVYMCLNRKQNLQLFGYM